MPKDSGDSPNLMKRTCEARAASPTLTQVAELQSAVLTLEGELLDSGALASSLLPNTARAGSDVEVTFTLIST